MAEMTIAGFMAHIAATIMELDHATHSALERASKVVQDEARHEIGVYQAAAGPFKAWAPLAPRTMVEKERLGYAPPDNPLLRTGELRDSIDRVVGHDEAVIGSNSMIAVYQELGTGGSHPTPPRSFLGGAAMRKAEECAHILGAAPVIALCGESVAERILGHIKE